MPGWRLFGDEQRMYLQTLDVDARSGARKTLVWLEDRGRRVFEPAMPGKMNAACWTKLQARVEAERDLLEAQWVRHMISKAWVRATLEDSTVTITAYPGSPTGFTRTLDLRRLIPGAHPAWDDEPPEVDFDVEYGLLRVGSEKDLDRRHRRAGRGPARRVRASEPLASSEDGASVRGVFRH